MSLAGWLNSAVNRIFRRDEHAKEMEQELPLAILTRLSGSPSLDVLAGGQRCGVSPRASSALMVTLESAARFISFDSWYLASCSMGRNPEETRIIMC
jgi:hypothetical protein